EGGGSVLSLPQVQLIDLGEDGTPDIAVSMLITMDRVGETLVLLNDGSGTFTAAPAGSILPAGLGNSFDVEVADFDGDGLADLFFCSRASAVEAAARSGGLQRLLFARP